MNSRQTLRCLLENRPVSQSAQELPNRPIVSIIRFQAPEDVDGDTTFEALHKAGQFLAKRGYVVCSMEGDLPIAFFHQSHGKNIIDRHGEERPISITKWTRLSQEEPMNIAGAILSDDFRDGSVEVVFFADYQGS
jgi:hypothetical protein